MKIVMLGDSAVGKTTLMVSTYGMMSEQSFKGFRVQCTDSRTHDKLVRAYRDFCSRGEYPPGTSKMESYQYDFFLNQEHVMRFTLTDIRGESIRYSDSTQLRNKLKEADAVMLFFNGYDVANGDDLEDVLFDLMPLLNASFETDSKRRMLMPVFTQIDRIGNLDENCVGRILQAAQSFEEMARRNDSLSCQIVPTACAPECMMDLDFMMITLMLFGYSTEVVNHMDQLSDERDSIQRQYDGAGGILGTPLDWLGLNPVRNAARERWKVLSKKIDHFQNEMVPKFNALKKFYDDYELFTSYSVKRYKQKNDPFDL